MQVDDTFRKLSWGGESALGELIIETVVAKAKGM